MTSDADLQGQLVAIFGAEAEERVQAMNRHLLALETDPSAEELDEQLAGLFREAHSLKGAAGAVGMAEVEAIAHRLESVFQSVRTGTLALHPAAFDGLYAGVDAIGALVQAAADGRPAPVDTGAVVAALERLASGAPDPHPPGTPDPHPAEGGAPEREGNRQPGAVPGAVHSPGTSTPDPAGAPVQAAGAEDTVRVAVAKLDALMNQVGELVVARIAADQQLGELRRLQEDLGQWELAWRAARPGRRSDLAALARFMEAGSARLAGIRRQVDLLARGGQAEGRRLGQAVDELREEVRRARMLPVSTVLDAFPRLHRDITRELGKEADLEVRGGDVEVDRAVLEQLRAPLTHLLRNALDHGLEAAEARARAGKPRRGSVVVAAAQREGMLSLEVADDGAGIDPTRVRARAVERGLLSAEEADRADDREVLDLIFRSGFSTATQVTGLSGRGVGLDVVREHVERLHGTITLDTQAGRGTRFRLELPLTVATTLCLLVGAAGRHFGLPVTNVVRIERARAEEMGWVGGNQVVPVDGRPLPVLPAATLLGLEPSAGAGARTVVVVGSAERRIALAVESLDGVQEVVIKPLPWPFARVGGTAGAATLASGEVVMILNAADLTRPGWAGDPGRSGAAPAPAEIAPAAQATVLVVDDSAVTRTLEKSILEAAGYQVRVAPDGAAALDLLGREPCDLVVTDIEMPRLDGFSLTARVRADERLRGLPVVLVTSLDSEDDRRRGVEVGADAYIVKGAFDQDRLLETIRRLI
ncbi:MAG TPA: hybrid sensor histidine kinase/response regulator [Actinomycetes bacterium]|nr:hybrid sensor histidine kinase/response regulator [Actinomycetes bacterium]